MLTIKTPGMKLERCKNDMISATPSMEALYIKFSDGIEMTIPTKMNAQHLDAIMKVAMQSSTPNVTIDFTNPKSLISLS